MRYSPWCWVFLCVFLYPSHPTSAAVQITEFMASNDSGLRDEDGAYSDWIEIHNDGTEAVSLEGYHLTDNPENLDKWTFPALTIDGGAYLVVFASGKNRVNPANKLHTDFNLSGGGEYLALVAPDGITVVSDFAPVYPEQFEDESFGVFGSTNWVYFPTPSPGGANSNGVPAGPFIEPLFENPPQPVSGPLTVTARVRESNNPVTKVELYYLRMFEAETMVPMNDAGEGGDVVAGDGIWAAVIPAETFAPGEMTRWRFVATDSQGLEGKEPPFHDPLDSHQYFGTVGADNSIETRLPVVHWFTSNPAGANTTDGSRGAVYYNGEFYDNVFFNLHGQSSATFPKKSYNVDFNRTQRFSWNTNAPRVADIDLLTNWADKSKVRNVLAYEVMRESGVETHFVFTVRIEQNGSFFSTADLIEDADETYLERVGLNPEGALYKVNGNRLNKEIGNHAGKEVEKKTRQFEDRKDLQKLIDSLALTGTALTNYLYDNIDIPRCVNMLAANSVIRNVDLAAKNWYIYRDTGRTDEWAMLPWDLDLSHGRFYSETAKYFDNALQVDGYVVTGDAVLLVAHLFQNPDIRAMIHRRIRTLTDRFLQPPPESGTPDDELYYERRLNEQLALVDPAEIVPSDADRDFEKWGSWRFAETMEQAIGRWKDEYLPGRRNFIYNTQIIDKGGEIPLPQTLPDESIPAASRQPIINFGQLEVSPASGNQDQEFIQIINTNSFAVDISKWRLSGGIEHTFLPGTVLPSNGEMYVCPDAKAFRARTISPKGGEGLFVQGGYDGHLSNIGETILLIDDAGMTNNAVSYQGEPSEAQKYLVVSELMYNPLGDGLSEFIELLNISSSVELDLSGVYFTNGVDFAFSGSSITTLPPGGRVVIVRNLSAFAAVYGTNVPVAGVFANDTALSNGGERIKIEDADSVTVQEFTYSDSSPWPPSADGVGYSLVLVNPQSHPDHKIPGNWRASTRLGGTPGMPDGVPFPNDPNGDANGNGEPDLIDYALGNDLGLPSIRPSVRLEANGDVTTVRLSYPVSLGAEGVRIVVTYSTDLKVWQDGTAIVDSVSTQELGDGRAVVTCRLNSPDGKNQLYIKLQALAL